MKLSELPTWPKKHVPYDPRVCLPEDYKIHNRAIDACNHEWDIEEFAKVIYQSHQNEKHAHHRLDWNDKTLSKNYYREKAKEIINALHRILKPVKG